MLFIAMLAAAAADIPETRAQSEQRTAELHARMDADHDGVLSLGERFAFQMRNIEKMGLAAQALKLACKPGAACETMRRN